MISKPLINYILTAARRDKLMLTLLLMIACGAALSVFLGSATLIEQGQFASVFAAGGLRILGVTGIVLFVCFTMRRAFENKEVEFLLSRPLSRTTFLVSHAVAFMLLSALAASAVVLPLFFAGAPNPAGLIAWGFSIAIEYAIMAAAAFFFSMVLSSAAGCALAAFGFYVLARLIGTLLGIAAVADPSMIIRLLGKLMNLISIIVPRLDLMGQTTWLVYGVEGSAGVGTLSSAGAYSLSMIQNLGVTGFVAAQGVVFIFLLLAATAFDFSRRRF